MKSDISFQAHSLSIAFNWKQYIGTSELCDNHQKDFRVFLTVRVIRNPEMWRVWHAQGPSIIFVDSVQEKHGVKVDVMYTRCDDWNDVLLQTSCNIISTPIDHIIHFNICSILHNIYSEYHILYLLCPKTVANISLLIAANSTCERSLFLMHLWSRVKDTQARTNCVSENNNNCVCLLQNKKKKKRYCKWLQNPVNPV